MFMRVFPPFQQMVSYLGTFYNARRNSLIKCFLYISINARVKRHHSEISCLVTKVNFLICCSLFFTQGKTALDHLQQST